MFMTKEYVLQGLKNHKAIINEIIATLDAGEEEGFGIRLILTEALVNAFYHGNKQDESKPVFLKYSVDGRGIRFEIMDSGDGFKLEKEYGEMPEDRLLDETGRGIYLVALYADKVEYINNTLVIEKLYR